MSGVVFVGEAHGGAADLQAEWDRASLRLLPRLLPAERGEVEVAVAVVELFDATAERGVGVEDLVADAEECTDARPVAAHALRKWHSRLGELGLGAVEDLHRRVPVVEGGVEVVVEVAAEGGVPGERPAHTFAERGDLLVRRPRHRDQRGVANVQLPQIADAVGGGRAARAAGVTGMLGTVGVDIVDPHEGCSPAVAGPRTGRAGPPSRPGPRTCTACRRGPSATDGGRR